MRTRACTLAHTHTHTHSGRDLIILNIEWGQIPVSFQSKLSASGFIGLGSFIIKFYNEEEGES